MCMITDILQINKGFEMFQKHTKMRSINCFFELTVFESTVHLCKGGKSCSKMETLNYPLCVGHALHLS